MKNKMKKFGSFINGNYKNLKFNIGDTVYIFKEPNGSINTNGKSGIVVENDSSDKDYKV